MLTKRTFFIMAFILFLGIAVLLIPHLIQNSQSTLDNLESQPDLIKINLEIDTGVHSYDNTSFSENVIINGSAKYGPYSCLISPCQKSSLTPGPSPRGRGEPKPSGSRAECSIFPAPISIHTHPRFWLLFQSPSNTSTSTAALSTSTIY